jgi:hypothetical protein
MCRNPLLIVRRATGHRQPSSPMRYLTCLPQVQAQRLPILPAGRERVL